MISAPRQKTILWTLHSRAKMKQYHLSPARVLRVLHMPKRIEDGVAPKTMAAMQTLGESRTENGESVWKQELWVMVQDVGSKRKIISAWRYPGVSKVRSKIALEMFRGAYEEYLNAAVKETEEQEKKRPKIDIGLRKWFKPKGEKRAWPKQPFGKKPVSRVIQVDE